MPNCVKLQLLHYMYDIVCNMYSYVCRIKERCEERHAKLGEALALHQFFRDIDDEEAWIREKKLLVSSEDFGRDLVSVQNLKKKHKRLESEIAAHEPAINQIQEAGAFNTGHVTHCTVDGLSRMYTMCTLVRVQ